MRSVDVAVAKPDRFKSSLYIPRQAAAANVRGQALGFDQVEVDSIDAAPLSTHTGSEPPHLSESGLFKYPPGSVIPVHNPGIEHVDSEFLEGDHRQLPQCG